MSTVTSALANSSACSSISRIAAERETNVGGASLDDECRAGSYLEGRGRSDGWVSIPRAQCNPIGFSRRDSSSGLVTRSAQLIEARPGTQGQRAHCDGPSHDRDEPPNYTRVETISPEYLGASNGETVHRQLTASPAAIGVGCREFRAHPLTASESDVVPARTPAVT